MADGLRVLPVTGLPEIQPGDDLGEILIESGFCFLADDVVVVTQKIISKAEGRLVRLETVEPRPEAREFARQWGKDPRVVELVLQESLEVLRFERGIIISRTRHGWVCANAGLDLSNVDGGQTACLLPFDSDASAARLQAFLEERLGFPVGIVISDSFGRPWRLGVVNVAIGVSGLPPLSDYRGLEDPFGLTMQASVMASADMVSSAAELVMGKTGKIPVAVVRGLELGEGQAVELVRPRGQFLFD